MKGVTIWFAGIAGASRVALANELEGALLERGIRVERLDEGEAARSVPDALASGSSAPCDSCARFIERCVELRDKGAWVLAVGTPASCSKNEDFGALGDGVLELLLMATGDVAERGRPPPRRRRVVVNVDAEWSLSIAPILKELARAGFIADAHELEFSAEQEIILTQRLKNLGYI